jgi:hypothetical protein
MNSVSAPAYSAATSRLWRVAILTAAGTIGTIGHADAALYYWQDYSDGSYLSRQMMPVQRQRPHKRGAATNKKEVVEKETGAKPQGPLVIAISIDRQKVTIFDSNGVFAQSPVSTGMKGHPTPMGVFSVIQKHKFHHSNIYSNAPMPYMQRITWSGVAMHAGVLPGYPASHGCIRMPTAFAVKMWNWTKMGARVIVTPGEMSPSSFSHPLLASMRVAPQPAASLDPQTDAPLGEKADKGASGAKTADIKTADINTAEVKSASVESGLELRSTVGHSVMSDATTGNALARDGSAPAADDAAKGDTGGKTADAAPAGSDATAALADKPAEKVAPAKTGEADAAKSEPAKSESVKSEPAKTESTKTESTKTEPAAAEKPDASVTATTPAAPDAKKDETHVAEPAAKPEPPKNKGQIAVFISRKDSKLYVRQNFAPLFDVPVTIAVSDRPLGTHIFTVEVDKNDANALHWSVVSLPVAIRSVERDDDSRLTRRQRMAGVIPVAAKPVLTPDNPAEALDRITVPADTMAKINEMLTTGSSIIVSDQGINQGETGEGTDFIVRLR